MGTAAFNSAELDVDFGAGKSSSKYSPPMFSCLVLIIFCNCFRRFIAKILGLVVEGREGIAGDTVQQVASRNGWVFEYRA